MIGSKLSSAILYLTSAAGFLQLVNGNRFGNLQDVLIRPHQDPSSANTDLEQWIDDQNTRSFGFLLDNIGPDGANAKETVPGTVIASPSKDQPNYYFQWIRDAAITMESVVNEFQKTKDKRLGEIIDYYADLQGSLQHTWNPSGGYTTGGLGEPKFGIDGAPFTSFVSGVFTFVKSTHGVVADLATRWKGPGEDHNGTYIRVLNETNTLDDAWLRKMYDTEYPTNSTIKADLEYVSQSWNLTGFDLWEEVIDRHFFTALVQHKALVEGTQLARALGDHDAAKWYDIQQGQLKNLLEGSFWNQSAGHLKSMLETPDRCGIDCALLLGSIHGGQDTLFPPWSSKVLASLEKLVGTMFELYPINSITPPYHVEGNILGAGVGRYPEDVYDGVDVSEGHPWFLCTSSVSSILYRTINQFVEQGGFQIDGTNLEFFNRLSSNGSTAIKGKYDSHSPEFKAYLTSMFRYADSFLNVIRWHATEEGRLSEQFNRYTGFQRGAKDLTWSYGSFIGAAEDRGKAKSALYGSGAAILT